MGVWWVLCDRAGGEEGERRGRNRVGGMMWGRRYLFEAKGAYRLCRQRGDDIVH